MASGFFSILDDVASLMDDVAVTSKIATQKTAGILGDDLAVNSEKATGFLASRELPVLWAITKGSLVNKLIIVPIALLLTAFFPIAIKAMLVAGGIYLAYEGAEKMIEYVFHLLKKEHKGHDDEKEVEHKSEKAKIKSAIATDFILSVEIVIIALGTVLGEKLIVQIIAVVIVSLLATISVYGLVALIVRMDDIGYGLIRKSKGKGVMFKLGNGLVKALPILIKSIGFIGTIALLFVSGGIFMHNIQFLEHDFSQIPENIKELFIGLAGGLIAVVVVKGFNKIFLKK